MTDREKDEQQGEQKAEQDTRVEDLDVPPEEADDVTGGKAQFQDLHFTHRVDKSSPIL